MLAVIDPDLETIVLVLLAIALLLFILRRY